MELLKLTSQVQTLNDEIELLRKNEALTKLEMKKRGDAARQMMSEKDKEISSLKTRLFSIMSPNAKNAIAASPIKESDSNPDEVDLKSPSIEDIVAVSSESHRRMSANPEAILKHKIKALETEVCSMSQLSIKCDDSFKS